MENLGTQDVRTTAPQSIASISELLAIRQHRVFITGGSGFIGTNLVSLLESVGALAVCSYDIVKPRNPEHLKFHVQGDICNPAALQHAMGSFAPSIVIHLAARTDLNGHSLSQYTSNTDGTRNVIEASALLHSSPSRVLFASSRLVCHIGVRPLSETEYCPSTAYGESKVVGENLVRSLGNQLQWTILRPTSIWGPWFGTPYRDFFDAVASSRYLHPKNEVIRKSFGFVGNSVFQIVKSVLSPKNLGVGRTMYLCDYAPLNLKDWADQISAGFDARPVKTVSMNILKPVARMGDALEFLSGNRVKAPLTSFRLNNLLTPMIHDSWGMDKVAPNLPFELADGVASTIRWMRHEGQR